MVKFFDEANIVSKPEVKVNTELEGYLTWLKGVVQQINASLHPCLPGKGRHVTDRIIF